MGYLLISLLVIYGMLVAWTYLPYPQQSDEAVDTYQPENTLYGDWFRIIVMNRSPLMAAPKEVIVIGGSGAIYGFRPLEIQTLLPGFKIHNLGIPHANITVMQKIMDLCYEVLPQSSDQEVIVVLGIWYGSFVDNKTLLPSGGGLIDSEMFRFGLYRKEQNEIVPVVAPRYFSYVTTLLRPSLALLALKDRYGKTILASFKAGMRRFFREGDGREVKKVLQQLIASDGTGRQEDLNAVVVDEDHKKTVLAMWRGYMGANNAKLHDEQFHALIELAEFLKKKGARLVIVDLPIPKWHAEGVVYFSDYQERKKRYLAEAMIKGNALYLDLQNMDEDFAFFDSIHPKPKMTYKWAERLAGFLLASQDG